LGPKLHRQLIGDNQSRSKAETQSQTLTNKLSMKKTAVMAALLLGSAAASSVLAQGQIVWGNVFGTVFRAPVYNFDPANPTQTRTGNPAAPAGVPGGNQTYAGALLNGTGFTLAIYAGANAAEAMSSMTALGSAPFRTGTAAGFVLQGTISVPNQVPGTTGINVQMRAWDNQMGQVNSWSEVLARGGLVAGAASDVFTVGPLGGVSPDGTLFQPPQTTGLRSFQLTMVPEPSLIALGALGLGALLLRRRK
jgi:hypothetical protein